jgi:hypothetical protein
MSKSLNRLTKVSQLSALDRDNQINWFNCAEVEEGDTVYLVGNFSEQLAMRFPTAIMLNNEFDPDTLEEDATILANTIIGSTEGSATNDIKLLQHLFGLRNRFHICAAVHTEGVPDFVKGSVMYKPRPHNLVAVVYLSDAEGFHKELDRINNAMIMANENRNLRYFKAITPALLRNFNKWGDISAMLRGVSKHRAKFKSLRADLYVPPHEKGTSARHTKYVENWQTRVTAILENPDYNFSGPHYKSHKLVVAGPLQDSVPIVGDPAMAINSVYRNANAQGYRVRYFTGTWWITK